MDDKWALQIRSDLFVALVAMPWFVFSGSQVLSFMMAPLTWPIPEGTIPSRFSSIESTDGKLI